MKEYSRKYRTAEIDSWFYKIPDRDEVESYLVQSGDDLRFTCKVTRDITLTHGRNFNKAAPLVPNPGFLSKELFGAYLDSIQDMKPRIDAVMFEFEYLNRSKMESVGRFTADAVIRLLGGDRREIEKKAGGRWNSIVDEKQDLEKIAEMAVDIAGRGKNVTINVNNHYEGSAPLTIERLKAMFRDRGR